MQIASKGARWWWLELYWYVIRWTRNFFLIIFVINLSNFHCFITILGRRLSVFLFFVSVTLLRKPDIISYLVSILPVSLQPYLEYLFIYIIESCTGDLVRGDDGDCECPQGTQPGVDQNTCVQTPGMLYHWSVSFNHKLIVFYMSLYGFNGKLENRCSVECLIGKLFLTLQVIEGLLRMNDVGLRLYMLQDPFVLAFRTSMI